MVNVAIPKFSTRISAPKIAPLLQEDPAVYVQWHASQIYQQLPAELQAPLEII